VFVVALFVQGAIGLLVAREAAVEEVLAVLLDEPSNAAGLNDVDAVAEDGHGVHGYSSQPGIVLSEGCGTPAQDLKSLIATPG
jgi:hypothetical protein